MEDQQRLQDAMKHSECTFMPNTQKSRANSANVSRSMRKSISSYDPRLTFTNPMFSNNKKPSRLSYNNNNSNNPISGVKLNGYTQNFIKKIDKESND